MNAVILSGTVARDPKVRVTQTGKTIASFTVMTVSPPVGNQKFPSKDYINCIAWGEAAQRIGNFGKTGVAVELKGRIGVRKYEQNGENKYVTEVTVEWLDIPGAQPVQQQAPQTNAYGFRQQPTAPAGFGQFGNVAMEEEVPF